MNDGDEVMKKSCNKYKHYVIRNAKKSEMKLLYFNFALSVAVVAHYSGVFTFTETIIVPFAVFCIVYIIYRLDLKTFTLRGRCALITGAASGIGQCKCI